MTEQGKGYNKRVALGNLRKVPGHQIGKGKLSPTMSEDYKSCQFLCQYETSKQPKHQLDSKRKPWIAGQDELISGSSLFLRLSCTPALL